MSFTIVEREAFGIFFRNKIKFFIFYFVFLGKMSKTTSLIDTESLKNLDASQAYVDKDGVFDCILNKVNK